MTAYSQRADIAFRRKRPKTVGPLVSVVTQPAACVSKWPAIFYFYVQALYLRSSWAHSRSFVVDAIEWASRRLPFERTSKNAHGSGSLPLEISRKSTDQWLGAKIERTLYGGIEHTRGDFCRWPLGIFARSTSGSSPQQQLNQKDGAAPRVFRRCKVVLALIAISAGATRLPDEPEIPHWAEHSTECRPSTSSSPRAGSAQASWKVLGKRQRLTGFSPISME